MSSPIEEFFPQFFDLSGLETKRVFQDHLPGAKIIGAEVEIPDMIWIWEVLGVVISFGS
jgi:hypothetical protein